MRLLSDTRAVLMADLNLLRRHKKLRISAIGIFFIPALYACIYISSLWSPEANAPQLPVVIVNHDEGTRYKDQSINVGEALSKKLQTDHQLGFSELTDEAQAKALVRRGEADFALIIPTQFSELAVGAATTGAGTLLVYTSEGNNYNGAAVAKRFAPEVSRKLNELLNENRWTKVSEIATDSKIKVERLKQGVGELNAGAQKLKEGLEKAKAGSAQLDSGMKQANNAGEKINAGAVQLKEVGLKMSGGMNKLKDGLGQMASALPADQDLMQLKDGSIALAANELKLSEGLSELQAGSQRLTAGVEELKTRSADIPIYGKKVAAGAQTLQEGSQKLQDGLSTAQQGQKSLQEGSLQLRDGVVRLTDGMVRLGEGIRKMHQQMPAKNDLDRYEEGVRTMAWATGRLSNGLGDLKQGAGRLDQGLSKLDEGGGRLAEGLKLLDEAIPARLDIPAINAAAYAASVKTEVEVVAHVVNQGNGFAANFIPLSLWVGAVMTSFLFHYRKLPNSVQAMGTWSKSIGKMLIPSGIVSCQVLMMLLAVGLLLGIQIEHPLLLAVTLLTASIVFVSIIMALVRWFGDTGRVMAVLFLILQLSASGGIVPIELSNDVFRTLHPYLPFTWVVKAIKVALFDAYDGQWWQMYFRMLMTPALLWPLAAYTGTWVYVKDEHYLPALDVE